MRYSSCLLLASLAAACARTTAPPPPVPTDHSRRVVAPHGAVSSANALASEAGLEILRAGGNAIDAAVATAFAIGVVEPQMSGLGGSGVAVVWLARERKAYDLDFYAANNAESFRGHTAERYPPGDLRVVGIPGDVAGLLTLHERFGKLPRARVMAPAIRLAEEGFPVGQVLAGMIASDSAKLSRSPAAFAHFWPNGHPISAGTLLRNEELAASLRAISAGGAATFYNGEIAQRVLAVLNAGGHPTRAVDLAQYRTRWLRPLCAEYRGHAVLSAAPPQTGLQVLHTLELLRPFDLRSLGLPTASARAFDVLTSALRVGQADARQNDDPDWAPVPAAGVVSAEFAASRVSLVGTGTATDSIRLVSAAAFDTAAAPAVCKPFEPYGPASPMPAVSGAKVPGGDGETGGAETTHMSIVDAEGNAVALTQTNSSVFGSGAWVAGFFLNDSGSRFTEQTAASPRSPWRTRTTTIAPTLVMDGDRVRMVIGAPGSGRIPTEIVQVMVYILDYGMDPLAAVRMPRIFPAANNRRVQLEHGFAPALLRQIQAMGYDVAPPSPEYARLYLIARGPGGWIAVADPRHDGEPRGY